MQSNNSKVIDHNLIMVWEKFKINFLTFIAEAPPFEVDLAFEYRGPQGYISSYSSGDILFINDIKLSSAGKICFEHPNGDSSKFIGIDYADNISNPHLKKGLDEIVWDCYSIALLSMEDKNIPKSVYEFADSLRKLENLSEVVGILNNSTEYLRKIADEERDRQSFQNIDGFGLF